MHARPCTALGLLAALVSLPALGCDPVSGERRQSVSLTWNGHTIDTWEVTSSGMQRIDLPNGVALGVRIDDAPLEAYADTWRQGRHAPELVRIALHDLSVTPAAEITTTFGGANSVQDFGADGGADRIESLGSPGIRMTLLKPVCAASQSTGGSFDSSVGATGR